MAKWYPVWYPLTSSFYAIIKINDSLKRSWSVLYSDIICFWLDSFPFFWFLLQARAAKTHPEPQGQQSLETDFLKAFLSFPL